MSINQFSVLMARIALFIVYFWFGLLKVIGQSPASKLVEALFQKTITHIPVVNLLSSGSFIVLFGLFEMLIGILFFLPGKERPALVLFAIHMITTILPLFVLIGTGASPWNHILVPTLEGQYIIKNLALLACALMIWSSVKTPKLENNPTPII